MELARKICGEFPQWVKNPTTAAQVAEKVQVQSLAREFPDAVGAGKTGRNKSGMNDKHVKMARDTKGRHCSRKRLEQEIQNQQESSSCFLSLSNALFPELGGFCFSVLLLTPPSQAS